MNLSGNAVRYWLNKENIDQKRLLVISDDVALPLGQFRLKASGSNGGHNGLGHIIQLIGQDFPRLRIGIGNDYPRGGQIDWVLGKYSEDDLKTLQPTIDTAADIIKIAMINVEKRLENMKSKMILQIHDELIIDAAKDEEEEVKKILSYEMGHAIRLSVPLVAEAMSATNWGELK